MTTALLFRDDAYLRRCETTVTAADERGIRLGATVFYPAGGGQPGDTGTLRFAGGEVAIADTVKGDGPDEVIHSPSRAPRCRRRARPSSPRSTGRGAIGTCASTPVSTCCARRCPIR